jgi:hypothetical protein
VTVTGDRQRHQITPPAKLHCSSGVTDSTLKGHFVVEWCNVLLIPLSCTEMGGTREVSAPAEQVHVFPCAGYGTAIGLGWNNQAQKMTKHVDLEKHVSSSSTPSAITF